MTQFDWIVLAVAGLALAISLANLATKAGKHEVKRRWGDNFRVLHKPWDGRYYAQQDVGISDFHYWETIAVGAGFETYDAAARVCDDAWTEYVREKVGKSAESVVG